MPRVIRSERAAADLIEILVTLRSRSPKAADRFEAEFEDKCRVLAQFPLMGRAREELAASLRSSLVSPYLVFYRPLEDGIEIIRVLHGSRDLPALFD